jgi:eukaryotic-like serine/threonine-protein kinase
MGEVYRASDARLGRDVAVKVLTAGVADPERLARFEQEARAAAALNHPNILAVFDIGHHPSTSSGQAVPYIVTELLEGETLRARLEGGPLPLRKALDYAVQIAHGLHAAHEKGIVHRDLKPENVFVTSDGRVKILDFGLAKLIHAEPAMLSGSMMATGIRETTPGMLMGTVAYMSPEQVRGAAADHRADIFALGTLLYEMITGRVAFQRATPAETMSAILRDEPEGLTGLGRPGLDRLIRRCLEKNPSARFQSALDFAFALESMGEGLHVEEAIGSAGSRTRERIAWSVAALAAFAAVALTWGTFGATPDHATPMSFTVLPPAGWHIDPGGETSQLVAVSPDGLSLAFAARSEDGGPQLWIRPLATLDARAVAGTEGGRSPFWSPDGRWLGFFAGGKLKKVEVAGGVPVTLCDAPNGMSAAWSSEGVILFSQISPFSQRTSAPGSQGIRMIPDTGGMPSAITTVAEGERGHSRPFFLPDNRHFLYSAGSPRSSSEPSRTVFVGDLDSPGRTKVMTTDSLLVTYAADHLLYLRGTTLVAHPFDAERLTLSGEPKVIADGIGAVPVAGGDRFGVFSASATGVLAYQTSASVAVHQLGWFDRAGRQVGTLGEPASYQSIELLPGDQRATMSVVDPVRRTRDIWIFDLARGVRTRLTFDSREERNAIPSPDGRFIAFNSNRSGALDIYRKSAAGAGDEQLLIGDGRANDPLDWSPDGRFLLFRLTTDTSSNDIMALPTGSNGKGDGKAVPVVATPFSENYAKLSPDGRWLAYTSDESGRGEVYVTSFPEATGKWQVSTDGGDFPRWRADGRELYYLAPGNVLTAVPVSGTATGFTVDAPQMLFKTNPPNQPGYPYAVTRDGQRFLVNTNLAAPSPLTVIVNWTAAIK